MMLLKFIVLLSLAHATEVKSFGDGYEPQDPPVIQHPIRKTIRDLLKSVSLTPQAQNDASKCPAGKIDLMENQLKIYTKTEGGHFFGPDEDLMLSNMEPKTMVTTKVVNGEGVFNCKTTLSNKVEEKQNSLLVISESSESCVPQKDLNATPVVHTGKTSFVALKNGRKLDVRLANEVDGKLDFKCLYLGRILIGN